MHKKLLILLQIKLKSNGTTSRTFSPALWQSIEQIRWLSWRKGSKRYLLCFAMVSAFHTLALVKPFKNNGKVILTVL